MSLLSLLVPLAKVELDAVCVEDNRVTITARSTQHAGSCPQCRAISARVHSRYTRTVADLPCAEHALTVALRVRRFFCDVPNCAQRTFAERFGTVLLPDARRLSRLTDALVALAFAAGGEGGARLAHAFAMPVSPRTLLRILLDKSETYSVAGGNADLRHYLARLGRRSRCVSRCIRALQRAVKVFVWCYNQRQLWNHRYPNYPKHIIDFVPPS